MSVAGYVGIALGAAGTEQIQTSPDGVAWTARSSPIDTFGGTCIQYGAGLFVALGLDSGDGTTWIAIVSSDNGETWTSYSVPAPSDSYTAVTYSPTLHMWLAVGLFGETIVSTDGAQTWTSATTLDAVLHDVAWGNGQFTTIGDGYSAASSNGSDWTPGGFSQRGEAVVYGDKWVAVVRPALETDTQFAYGTDGLNWTYVTVEDGANGVDWDGITYIAADGNGAIFRSTTGAASWVFDAGMAWDCDGQRVLYDPIGALWLIALDGDSTTGSTVATSDDGGGTWTLQTTPITDNLREIAGIVESPAVTLGNTWRGGFQQRVGNTLC